MRRRDVLAVIGGATFLRPFAASGQQKAMPVIGWLHALSAPRNPRGGPIHDGLTEAGFVEGQNWAGEYRSADGNYDRLPALAADLVSLKVDLIIATAGPAALAAKSATSTIPIVFSIGADAVELGLIASLARPGGNLTGVSILTVELTPKRFDLLFELIPHVKVIGLLANPNNRANIDRTLRDAEETARAIGVQLNILKASSESEIDTAFSRLDQLQAGGLLVADDAFFYSRYKQLVTLAARHALPTIYGYREITVSGGLISYGANAAPIRRQAGIYAARILRCEKPADLPVQQATTYELVINMKTAKALGLTVPQSLLARADEVIE
jgi:putative ABC transport system substrate-binding protein